MQQIDDITLLKVLGKGAYGEVYLSTKKGRKEYYATKKLDRSKIDNTGLKKYFDNEQKILNSLNHPNIVKLEGMRKTSQHYYIVMEYVNGGMLSDCLKKYKDKYNKAFPEEIVQHLMKQLISALYYIHSRKIIHRDLKLDNIMVNFDSESDKLNLNMMKANIKIIDFGFATKLNEQNLAFTAIGSPINMDPIILEKFSKKRPGVNPNELGYDEKADIWSTGTVCYELLIGKAVFDAKTLNDLVDKVQKGSYLVPSYLSKEVISFLNGMLQYNSKYRLSSAELLKHPFLTKNPSDFSMKTVKACKKNNIELKKNKSIWAIFENEDNLINIEGGKMTSDKPIVEEDEEINNSGNKYKTTDSLQKRSSSNKNAYNYINPKNYPDLSNNYPMNNNNFQRTHTFSPTQVYGATSFYGQNMHPNIAQGGVMRKMTMPNNMNYAQIPNMIQQQPIIVYPSFGVDMPYSYGGGIYDNQQKIGTRSPYSNNMIGQQQPKKNINYKEMYKGTEYEKECCIQ